MEQVVQRDSKENVNSISSSKQKKLTFRGWWRKYYVYVVSSVIIIAAILCVLALKGFWPFGKSVLLDGDFAMQSWPYLTELKRKILSGESMIYTWNAAYGTNFFAVFVSLVNPLTIIYLLLPAEAIMPFSSIAFIILELAMNWSMLYFLTHRPLHRLEQNQLSNMMFSISYALCMYSVSNINNWHLMVTAVCFPLILLGLERFVANQDWKLYYIMLVVSFLCEYYMTSLFCVFIILYYLTLEFENFQIFVKKSIKILGISIASILTVAVILFPAFYQLLSQNYTISEYVGENIYTTFFDTIKNFMAFNTPIDRGTTSYSYGEVNLYYGIFLLMLSSFYFIDPKIKKEVRIRKLLVTVIYLLAFNINGLNYIMHLFHYPSWFPNRFSLNFTIFCIILAYDAWVSMKETEFRYVTIWRGIAVGLGWFFMTLLCFAFSETVEYQFTYYYSIMFFMFYMIGLLLLPYFKKKFPTVLSVFACIEICMCFMFALIFKNANSNIYSLSEAYTEKKAFLNEHPLEESHGFSRMMDSGSIVRINEGMLFGKKGNAIFSSSITNVGDFLECAGVYIGGNYIFPYTYNQATASLMNIQYAYENVEQTCFTMPESLFTTANSTFDAFTIRAQEGPMVLYENPTVLSLGYMIDKDAENAFPEDLEEYKTDHVIYEGINDWVAGVCGVTDVMQEGELNLLSVQADNCCFAVRYNGIWISNRTDVETDKEFVEYLENENVMFDMKMQEYNPDENSVVSLEYEAEEPGEYLIQIADQVVATGYLEKGETFTVSCVIENAYFDEYENVSSGIYINKLDNEQWQKAYDILSQQQLEVTDYSSTTVDGTIQVKEDGILFTSIPYDKNWHMYVDGEEVDILPLWSGSFIAVQLDEGEHTIHLEYRQSGLILGGIISFISITIVAVFIGLKKKMAYDYLLESEDKLAKPADDFYDEEYLESKREQKRNKKEVHGEQDCKSSEDMINEENGL